MNDYPSIFTTKDGGHVIRDTNVYVKEMRDTARLSTARARLYEISKSRELGEESMEPGDAIQLFGNTWAVYQPEADEHFEYFETD